LAASSSFSCSSVSIPAIFIVRHDDVSGATWSLLRSHCCMIRISATWDWSILFASLSRRGLAPCASAMRDM
jgi:hypothetical protein